MKRGIIILLHTGYWLVYLLLLAIFFGAFVAASGKPGNTSDLRELFFRWMHLVSYFALIPGILAFYVFYALLSPRLLARRKIPLFFAAALGAVTLIALISVFLLTLARFTPNIYRQHFSEIIIMHAVIGFIALINGIIGVVMHGFIHWYSDLRIKEELKRKNLENELALLRARLHPHFLFNTINNIDTLIHKDPGMASDYLIRLSELLRFMLYETGHDEVLLSDEIGFLEKYVSLQRIRTSNAAYVNLEIAGHSGNRRMAPMLFMPFVENAFKYAANKKTERAIDIRITSGTHSFIFECSNHFVPAVPNDPKNSGLGQSLTRKRLELLYPGRHRLDIGISGDIYRVKLEIDWHEDQVHHP